MFSHAKKVVHEGVEGNILRDILHWLLIKQKVMHNKKQCLSCDVGKSTSGFWRENSSFDD